MKYEAAIIIFSVGLLVILESSNTLQCYQCTDMDPGCNANLKPPLLLKPCPAAVHQCFSYYPSISSPTMPASKRGCLSNADAANCSEDDSCYPCSEEHCNS